MATELPQDDVQRWTAKRRFGLVLSICSAPLESSTPRGLTPGEHYTSYYKPLRRASCSPFCSAPAFGVLALWRNAIAILNSHHSEEPKGRSRCVARLPFFASAVAVAALRPHRRIHTKQRGARDSCFRGVPRLDQSSLVLQQRWFLLPKLRDSSRCEGTGLHEGLWHRNRSFRIGPHALDQHPTRPARKGNVAARRSAGVGYK